MGKMLGGEEEKDPDASKKEEERQEALRQQEEERKAKHARMEAEREKVRQTIRDKVCCFESSRPSPPLFSFSFPHLLPLSPLLLLSFFFSSPFPLICVSSPHCLPSISSLLLFCFFSVISFFEMKLPVVSSYTTKGF